MRQDDDQPTRTPRRLKVREAADELGITVEAVRGRIKRGKLEHVKEGGTVYVLLTADRPPTVQTGQRQVGDRPDDRTDDQTGRVEDLKEQIAYLRLQLDEEREARRRADTLLARLTEANASLAGQVRELTASEAVSNELGSAAATGGRLDTMEGSERVGPSTGDPAEYRVRVKPIFRTPKDHLPLRVYLTLIFFSAALYFLGTGSPILSLTTYAPIGFGFWLGLRRRGSPYLVYASIATCVGLLNLAAVIIEGWITRDFFDLWEHPSQWPQFLLFMGLLPGFMFASGTLFGDVIKRRVWPESLAESTPEQGVSTTTSDLSPTTKIILAVIPPIVTLVVAFITTRGP